MYRITCTSTEVHGVQGSERFLFCTRWLNPLINTDAGLNVVIELIGKHMYTPCVNTHPAGIQRIDQ